MLVLDVNDKGVGEGLLYGVCRVKFTKDNQLEIEHFGQAPAQFEAVRLWKQCFTLPSRKELALVQITITAPGEECDV